MISSAVQRAEAFTRAEPDSACPLLRPPSVPALGGTGDVHLAHRWLTVLDGQRLRQVRRQHGLSQERLAYRAGISLATVARLEREPRPHCHARTAALIAAALGEHPSIIAPIVTGSSSAGRGGADD